jgi:hypothetical protein
MRRRERTGKRSIYSIFRSLVVSDERDDISGAVDDPLDGYMSRKVAIENHIISERQDVGVGREPWERSCRRRKRLESETSFAKLAHERRGPAGIVYGNVVGDVFKILFGLP